jgi:hypothetical protein
MKMLTRIYLTGKTRKGKNILLPELIHSNEMAKPTGREYLYSITEACASACNKSRYVGRIFVQSITGEFYRYIPYIPNVAEI